LGAKKVPKRDISSPV